METPEEDFELVLSDPSQLDMIDKLRDLGIQDVALPQLVVVGDQSSSVLEAFSGLPFARDSGLCTRFATQIIMRRTSVASITVSISPHNDSTPARAEKLRAFSATLNAFSGDMFSEIFTKACDTMGVSSVVSPPADGQSTFCRDVLKFELSGPQHDNLTIIDIPGIFRTPTPGLTTKDDMELVNQMVLDYIRDQHTIILAVLPANVDLATQSILTMAAEVDPEGLRTLGVLTKPDLIDEGAEKQVIDLIEGKSGMKLKLGYYVVRNRGQKDLLTSSEDRFSKEEAFFSSGPWAAVDPDRAGVKALKRRLPELLESITRQSMPLVKREIDSKLDMAKTQLVRLGDDRETSEQRRTYLQQIATDFQTIADSALDVYYERNDVFGEFQQLRLPTIVGDRSEQFSISVHTEGHAYGFEYSADDTDDEDGSIARPEQLTNFEKRDKKEDVARKYPELEGIFPDVARLIDEPGPVIEWIEKEYRRNRGFGIADVGHAVLPTLWKLQSKNWESLAAAYVKDIVLSVHDFIHTLLRHVCPDERTRRGLSSLLNNTCITRYVAAIEHAKFIVEVERLGTLLTQNRQYNDTLHQLGHDCYCQGMRERAIPIRNFEDNRPTAMYIPESALDDLIPMSNIEHAVSDLHAKLKAYYKVARKRFIDVICMQVTGHYLTMGKTSPLRVFDAMFVAKLTDKQLEEIAGEEPASKRRRQKLKTEIEALTVAKSLLRY